MHRTRLSSYLACSILLLLAPLGHADTEEPGSDNVQRGVKAEPIQRGAPVYPIAELNRGQQGWVELSFVVTVDGKVIDPVVQDSSGSEFFESAALRTVEDWEYTPARWNDEAVQQCENKVMITFALEGEEKNVSPAFNRRYRKVDEALTGDELDEAKELLDTSFESLGMTLAEIAWYSTLQVRYYGSTGNKDAQLKALRRATASDGKWVDDALYPNLLVVKATRELENSDFSAALSTYDKLLKTKSDAPQIEYLQPIFESVQNKIASSKTFQVPAEIFDNEKCEDCKGNWDYRLLRQKFSLAAISGELGDLEIRCSRQRLVDKAREGFSWVIPDSWGNCSVIVFGEPGATFNLLEEPSA